jgi:hypothetical protein
MKTVTMHMWGTSNAPEDWELLGEIDESEPYEVDQTAIFRVGKTFRLATASGCSCWDGEWEVSTFRSLDRLFDAIGINGKGNDHIYQPTLKGAETLREQVLASLG